MRTIYADLSANDMVVLSHIIRSHEQFADYHITHTARGISLTLRITERHARRILDRLVRSDMVIRSKNKHYVSGTYTASHRCPFYTYEITPIGKEAISRFLTDTRWWSNDR